MPAYGPRTARGGTGGTFETMSNPSEVVREHHGAELARRFEGGLSPQSVVCSPWMTADLARSVLRRTRSLATLRDLAAHPASPADVLARLAAHKDSRIAARAVRHPNLPFEVAQPAVARHGLSPALSPHCPAEVLQRCWDQQARLRPSYWEQELLRHRNTPHPIRREALTSDVSSAVTAALECPQATHADYELALSGATTDKRRRLLKWQWSKHPGADGAWLAYLAHDQSPTDSGSFLSQALQVHLARNPATPSVVLHELAMSRRSQAVANPMCPVSTLEELAGTDWFLGRSNPSCREVAANHPLVPLATLAVLTADDIVHTRSWFIEAQARTAEQAAVMLQLAAQWPGTLAELVVSTAAATR